MTDFLTPLRGKPKQHSFNTFDIETTTDLERVYLLGWYDGVTYRYFESEPKHPEAEGSPIDQFMRWLTGTNAYCGHWNYGHNAGNFDTLYIVRWVWEHADEFTMEVVPLQSSILMLEVRSKEHPNKRWTFLDSFRLMPAKLDKLGKAFGIGGKTEKKHADGSTVDEDDSKEVERFYAELHKNPLRYEYLKRDCVLLYDCRNRFGQMILDMGGEVGVTAPSTAMVTFRRSFLKREHRNTTPRIILGSRHTLDDAIPTNRHFPKCKDEECPGCLHAFVREGYYGGRVEVYREEWTGPGLLTLLDVNSMYPAAMLEPMPVEFANEQEWKVSQYGQAREQGLAGFIDCTVEIPDGCYLPPLPYRTESKLVFPCGKFRGVWASVELENVQRSGGRIVEVHRSIWFKCERVLASYVRHFYAYRDKSRPDYDEAFDMVAKLLLNSLYGKFGMNEKREKLWFFPTDEDFADHRLTPLEDAMHGAFTEPVETQQPYVVPHIAAWVTAIARSRLWGMMRDILDKDGRVWYCDTDSIVTDLDYPSSTALGELKQVCKIERALFAAPKLYFLRQPSGEEYVKAKGFGGGFGAGKLTEDDFMRVVKAREKLTTRRMTKLREGMNSPGERFPRMKHIEKGIHGTDEKRFHLSDGNTRALKVGSDFPS